VVVLLVAAVFFFQYAVEQGWIGEAVRVMMVGAFGLLLIACGEWAFRKAMRIFSAAVTGGGIALLYAAAYAASPNFYGLIPTSVAFAVMCAVTAIGVGLSLRSGMLATAILAQIGAFLTPILLNTETAQQTALLMIYLAVTAAGFLVVAYKNRWQILAPLSLAWTILVLWIWLEVLYAGWYADMMDLSWFLLMPFVAYAALGTRAARATNVLGMVLAAVPAALMAMVFSEAAETLPALYGNLLALNVAILAVCWWRNWPWVRLVVLVWTLYFFPVGRDLTYKGIVPVSPEWTALATWGCVFFGVFVADIVIRFRSALTPKLDAGLLIAAGSGLLLWLLDDSGLLEVASMASVPALIAVTLWVCLLRRWRWPRIAALVWWVYALTHTYFRYVYPDYAVSAMWTWIVIGMFVADAVIRALPRVALAKTTPDSILVTVAGGWLILWITVADTSFSAGAALGHVLALDIVLLALCWWRRWQWPRAAALVWTAWGLMMAVGNELPDSADTVARPWFFATWAWVLFGLLTVDVLIRLRRELTKWLRKYNATLATIATTWMAFVTWGLLGDVLSDWGMAAYTACLSAAAIAGAIALRKLTDRRILSYAYLGQGLVLAAFVAPMALDEISVTVAWSAQAAVAMLLASRLREKMLLVKSVGMLVLAGLHFLSIDLAADSAADVLVTLAGVEINTAMLSATALAAGGIVSAGILRAGAAVWDMTVEKALSLVIVCSAGAVWAWQTHVQLPPITATWWWLIGPAGAAVVALVRRRNAYAVLATLALGAVMAKFVLHDCIYLHADQGVDFARQIVVNWQSALGLLIAVGALVWSRTLARHRDIWPGPAAFGVLIVLLAALVVVWTGSFEIDRAFAIWQAGSDADLGQAMQMAYSVWWGICAISLLVAGLLTGHTASRYMALVLLAVTLGKVLLVDMADVETVWRILSFLATGSVLVGSSLAYQRYFGRTTGPQQTVDRE
jgi:hypothetical protein